MGITTNQAAEGQSDAFRRMKIFFLKSIAGIQANNFTGWVSRHLARIQSYGHLVPGAPALGAYLEWRQVVDWHFHLRGVESSQKMVRGQGLGAAGQWQRAARAW